jgi:centromere/kinetochore protein ZW10
MFINQRLPAEFTVPLSEHLMPNLVAEIKATWLDSAVPVSINDMVEYRKAIALVDSLAASLASMNWAGSEEMQDWVASAPKIWLAKRRETSLDWVRNQLALGIGITKEVERTETQEISRSEGQHIPREVNSGTNDWNSAWSDGGHDDGNNGEAGSSSPRLVSKVATNTDAPVSVSVPAQDDGLEDDAADAWGWGDEDDTAETQPESHTDDMDEESNEPPPNLQQSQISVRQVTLTEKYRISSMPGSVLDTVTSILEDAVTLTKDEHADNPVSAAAAGLFSLPTLVLAIYRAVSPAYYQESDWGNMYLYNDALWLAEQLQTLSSAWSSRDDLPSRAHGKIRLDSEVLGLETFGKRAYAQEMTTQKTILHDLLGGSQNFLQRDGHVPSADDDEIEGVVARIQSISADWKRVLTKSAWAQAMGSLLSSMARKIILDVQELTALGADEAYRAAGLITKMLKLDELFLPDDQAQAQIPTTSKYAPHWLKLQFLNEVLQSDLKDVMFLWLESDLSLYFSAEEVVDLIEASFEDNPRRRVAISRIKNEPNPKGVGAEDA